MSFQAEKNLEIKKDWVSALEKLMNQIEQWVSVPEWKETISIEKHYVEKNEEHLGNYQAPVLFISGENNLLEVRPVGRFAIGAIGRIDIMTGRYCYSLLYSSKKGWICLDNRKPFTKNSFLELLEKAMKTYPASESDRLH